MHLVPCLGHALLLYLFGSSNWVQTQVRCRTISALSHTLPAFNQLYRRLHHRRAHHRGCGRELADLAAPGGLAAAGTILFLSLAWSGVEAPQAFADIDIPYQVGHRPFCRCNREDASYDTAADADSETRVSQP